jgi:hypothetical protein
MIAMKQRALVQFRIECTAHRDRAKYHRLAVHQTQREYVSLHRLEHSERRSTKISGDCDRTVVISQYVISVLLWMLFLCKQVFKIKGDAITVLKDL